MRVALTLGLVSAIALAHPLDAQGRGRGKNGDGVPPGHLPPAGQCRVWIDGVPPGRQPAPTDCATAERTRPANGRVIYGAARRDDDRKDRDDRRDRDRRDADRRDDDRRDSGRTGSVPSVPTLPRNGSVWGTQACVDRDKDGRCDNPTGSTSGATSASSVRYPSALPEMISTAVLRKQERSNAQTRWLGTTVVRATYLDRDGDRRPERIVWSDRSGQVVQKWVDSNRDGRADYVEVWRGGRLVTTRR